MKRRTFIAGLGAAAAWPLVGRAQQAGGMRLIGGLMALPEDDPEGRSWLAAFEQGLAALGWTAGRNIRLVYRSTGGISERTQALAKELVELRPAVILTTNTPAVMALMQETRTIPIIFTNLSDPLDTGVVTNLARPGKNVTGFTAFEHSLSGKWLEFLKEADPRITRTVFMYNPDSSPYAPKYIAALREAGARLGVTTTEAAVRGVGDFEPAIAAEAGAQGASLVVMPSAFTNTNRGPIVSLAARYRLPAIYPYRAMAVEGGLMAYNADTIDLYRRAASYVDRVLRNEDPGQLPVQQPAKYQFVINLKTAKDLGLNVSRDLLSIADEVIE
jgi:putative tryptophan/tyrosine transport system substrate-binding protein